MKEDFKERQRAFKERDSEEFIDKMLLFELK